MPGRISQIVGSSGACRLRGRASSGFEQVHPFLLVVPFFRQLHGDVAAAMAGGAGGDVYEVQTGAICPAPLGRRPTHIVRAPPDPPGSVP